MGKQIAALIPTYHRAHLLPDFIKNHNDNSTDSKLYFIVNPGDTDTMNILEELGESILICNEEYVGCINFGFDHTEEPFVLCAADDVLFMPGWDTTLLELTEDKSKHIFGGLDEWKISQTLKHISHPLVRREHFVSPLYYPEYIHYMCDIEFINRGWKEGSVMITPQVLILHPHTVTEHLDKKLWDETYKRSFSKITHDAALYDRRKAEFELWEFENLKDGRVMPTKLNPLYNDTLLSIVIPSYNDTSYLKECLASVIENTYYRYEIIIVDDGPAEEFPTPWEKVNRKKFLDSMVLPDESCTIRVVHNDKQEWINHNWNLGAEMARGNYVAFLNTDIKISKEWDKYLISALNTPARPFTIACPYEINRFHKKPFKLDKFFLEYAPHMIKGPCFLMRKTDADKIFPIPSQIKHWCGDSLIADRALAMNGTVFAMKATFYHHISKSSNTIKPFTLQLRTYTDIMEYEKFTGKNMNFIKGSFPEVIKNYYSAGVRKYKNPR